jgi:hypothetical protein
MPKASLTTRVDILEQKVGELEKLPERAAGMELQIVQLRGEVRAEFSNVRQEFATVREEMRHEFATVREEMRQEFMKVRAEMNAGDEDTRRLMRVLHEEVIARLALIQEGRPPRKRRDEPS